MKRKVFYMALRKRNSGLFGTSINQGQVDGIEAILAACIDLPVSFVAYMLATPYLETAQSMRPVKETVMPHHRDKNPSDREVIRRLDRAWARGQLGQVSRPYWRDGWFGRGFPQITHKRNYKKSSIDVGVDLIADPDLALDPVISAKILVMGSMAGTFTGKKLSDYLPGDYVGARRIINGRDRAKEIAKYAIFFERALKAADWGEADYSDLLVAPPLPDGELPNSVEQPACGPKPTGLSTFISAIILIFKGGAK